MLDVGRLRVLLAISEHGELSAAARALATPAGEAAAQLTALERELGLAVIEGDRLTPAGHRLAAHAGRLLPQLEAAEADAAAVAGRAGGLLRLGIGAAAGRALLPDALATLRTAAPDLDLRVEQLADERAAALGAGRLDVVVIGEFAAAVPRRADAEVERRELLTEPLLVAVPARHPVTGTTVRLAGLAGERWVAGPVGGDALTALERAAATAGFEPRLVGHAAEDGLALALVAAGVGIALVPASSVPAPVEGIRFLTALDPGLRRTVTAVVRRSAAADPAVQRLLDALGQAARRVAAAVPGVTAAAPTLPVAPEPRRGPTGLRPPAGRRPDPLFDPLPGGDTGADVPTPRRRPVEPWADSVPPAGLTGPRPESRPEPKANGYSNGIPASPPAGSYGLDPYRSEGHRTEPTYREPTYREPTYREPTYREPTHREPTHREPTHREPTRREPARPDPARPDPSRAEPSRQQPGRPEPPREDAPRNGRPVPPAPPRPLDPDPRPPRRRRDAGPLPPPGIPVERPRAAAPPPPPVPPLAPAGPATPAEPPPLPHPTSPDLGVRSLAAGDLPRRRSSPPGRPAGTGSYAERAGTVPDRRGRDDGPDSLPPAPAGSAEDVRLSIFEDLQSEWFTQHDDAPAPTSWQTAADDGWRAAARLAEPTTAGTTTAGLPRRRPQALYVPGTVGGDTENPQPPAPTRSPQEVRGRLSSYRDGVRRGRHAEPRED